MHTFTLFHKVNIVHAICERFFLNNLAEQLSSG